MTIGTWGQHRTIVLDLDAQEFVDRQSSENQRFEQHWRGIEWMLSRTPDGGTPRSKEKPKEFLLYVFPGNDLARTKDVWVLYSYDSDIVTVHGVRFA